MVADDLGNKGKSEPCPVILGGHERIKDMRQQIGRYAGAIVSHGNFQRQ